MSLFTIFLCTATGSCIALSPPTAASKCHDAPLGRVMLETPRCNHRTTISLTRSSEQISRRIFTPSAVVRAIARVDRVSSASSAVALPAAVAEFVVLAFVAFLHLFSSLRLQLQCHISTLEFVVDVFAAALTSPSKPIKVSGPPSPPSRRHRWLIVALYFWSDVMVFLHSCVCAANVKS